MPSALTRSWKFFVSPGASDTALLQSPELSVSPSRLMRSPLCAMSCTLSASSGSVTLCSMLFIVLAANWYGPKTGVLVGLAYGILQFLQEPYVLSFFQVCCDYILAFAALGTAGFFAKSKHGLVKGYIAAVIARGAFHALGGYLYWMDYMPDNFPQSLRSLYPILYNYSYLLVEAVITVILISIPAVAKGLNRVKQTALE